VVVAVVVLVVVAALIRFKQQRL